MCSLSETSIPGVVQYSVSMFVNTYNLSFQYAHMQRSTCTLHITGQEGIGHLYCTLCAQWSS